MTMSDIRHITHTLRTALAIEAAGGDWSVPQAAAVLGVSRRTFYRLPYFRQRLLRPSPNRVTVRPADVRLYQALNSGVAVRRAG
jgi:hypothetical protein